ncbi:hypothetical protein PROFUN_07350 [Planoprotostelium fungivorum]|uniref:Uncharacterized protein n=1 Tax=Planoprotostelium fungivorum TaxID=1890364 RepID=A0A2P6NLX2_9EUKA|nr:hypothetical protein PROFUN_07350 [Planoprotostelium fungivorum]
MNPCIVPSARSTSVGIISKEEVRKQLETLGFRNVPDSVLEEFVLDLQRLKLKPPQPDVKPAAEQPSPRYTRKGNQEQAGIYSTDLRREHNNSQTHHQHPPQTPEDEYLEQRRKQRAAIQTIHKQSPAIMRTGLTKQFQNSMMNDSPIARHSPSYSKKAAETYMNQYVDDSNRSSSFEEPPRQRKNIVTQRRQYAPTTILLKETHLSESETSPGMNQCSAITPHLNMDQNSAKNILKIHTESIHNVKIATNTTRIINTVNTINLITEIILEMNLSTAAKALSAPAEDRRGTVRYPYYVPQPPKSVYPKPMTIKKTDPVKRYHELQAYWSKDKFISSQNKPRRDISVPFPLVPRSTVQYY